MNRKIPLFYYDNGSDEGLYWVRTDGDEVTTDQFVEAFSDRLRRTFVMPDAGRFPEQLKEAARHLDGDCDSVVNDAHEKTIFVKDEAIARELIEDFEQCLPS